MHDIFTGLSHLNEYGLTISLEKQANLDCHIAHTHSLLKYFLPIKLAQFPVEPTDHEIAQTYHAPFTHDLGKLSIPDEILLKPGPLNNQEWLIMQRHPAESLRLLGADWVEANPFEAALDLYHHVYGNQRFHNNGHIGERRQIKLPIDSPAFGPTLQILMAVDHFSSPGETRPYPVSKFETLAEHLLLAYTVTENQLKIQLPLTFSQNELYALYQQSLSLK